MKKISLFLLFLLCIVPLTSAVSIDIQPSYHPGETLISKVYGNILEQIPRENVELLRGHVQVAADYDIKKIGNDYYIYMILPTVQNNYTLVIKDVVTTVNGTIQTVTLEKNFTTLGPLIDYSINPGVIISKENFKINIFSYIDSQISINTDFPDERSIILNSGENSINFDISLINNGIYTANVGTYNVPILINKEEDNSLDSRNLKFLPGSIEGIVLINHNNNYPIRLVNSGSLDISDLTFEFDKTLFDISPSIVSLESGQSVELNLTVKKKNQPINSQIIVRYGDQTSTLLVNLDYTTNSSNIIDPYNQSSAGKNYYCNELQGKFCGSGETCSTDTLATLDGQNCCIGTCTTPSKSSYSWLGYLIVFILIVVLLIIGARYYKTKKIKK